MKGYRIGYGEDIHRLVEDRKLILAGVEIPFSKGLLGHSDADVVYHAIADALLGSLALGDIGHVYPDNDPRTEGIDSSIILKSCYGMVKEKGYEAVNLDVSISAEKPKLASHIPGMRKNIADCLEIDLDQVSIKAMTNEGLDAVGHLEAIRATCIVLVKEKE